MEIGVAKGNLHRILEISKEVNYVLETDDLEAIKSVLKELEIRNAIRDTAYEEGFREGYKKGEANGYKTGYVYGTKWCQDTIEEDKKWSSTH